MTPLGAFNWGAAGAAGSIWTLTARRPLVDEINAGSEVTILVQPTIGVPWDYLFNTLTSNPGYLNVTVQAVPEPSTVALSVDFLCVTGCSRFYRREN